MIVSDDAGQFNVGQHGLCWIHAERLVHKLDTFTDENRLAQGRVRGLIWPFYRDLKAIAAIRQSRARRRYGHALTASSRARLASLPSTVCLRGSMLTNLNC